MASIEILAVLAVVMPLVFGTLFFLVSASYVAAPATFRASIPDVNPGLYLVLPLAITFPMNLGEEKNLVESFH